MAGYVVANANEIIVVTGLGIEDFVLTKKRWVWPLFQKCRKFLVSPITYDISIKALSQEKLSFTIPGSINVGPNVSDEKEMKKYVLLLVSAGGNQDQENVIRERVMGILEGEMRQVAASMTIEEIYNNRKQFQARIAEYVSSSLAKFGLVLYNAAIKELQDNGGYFTIMGERASQAAASVAKVSVAESKMLSDIGATDRNCRAQRETVRLKTEGIIYENQRQQSIVQSKAELEVKNAKFKADSKVAEIEGQKKAEVRDQELKRELESKRVTVELQRMRAENLTKATVDGEKIMKMAEAAAYETKKKAEAKLFEMQKIAEGKLFQAEKEAEGIQKMYMAQAEGLNELITSFNDEEAALQYILMDKNIYKMLATQNALSIQGMKPTINVWNTDGEDAGSVTGLIKSLPPMLTAIKDQTGIDPPKWLATLPVSDDLWRRDFEYARDVTPDKVEKPTQSFKTDPNKEVRNSLKTGQDFAVSRDGTESVLDIIYIMLLILVGIVTATFCAPFEWTWLSGEEALFSRGYESAQFVERFSVSPSARSLTASCYDPVTSKFFVFSGYGVFMKPDLIYGHLCDLWSFDTTAGFWSKLKGSAREELCYNNLGTYTDKGRFSDTAMPSKRTGGATICWDNQYHLVGGITTHLDPNRRQISYVMDDIWSYDGLAAKWKWSRGNKPGSLAFNDSMNPFSLINIFNSDTDKQAINILSEERSTYDEFVESRGWRINFTEGYVTEVEVPYKDEMLAIYYPTTASDYDGSSYVFGGYNDSLDYLGLWKLDRNFENLEVLYEQLNVGLGVYEKLPFPSSHVYPRGRAGSTSAFESNRKILLLFGGEVGEGLETEYLNDLWSFSVQNSTWRWLSGSLLTNNPGNYAARRSSSTIVFPRSRSFCNSFVDKKYFYVFGGQSFYKENGKFLPAFNNDFWRFELEPLFETVSTTLLRLSSSSLPLSSRTIRPIISNLENDSFNYTIYVVIGSLIFAMLIVLLVVARYFRKRGNANAPAFLFHQQIKNAQYSDSGMATSASIGNSLVPVTNMNATTMFTKSQSTLALPGYLEFPKAAFVCKRKVFKGVGGEIYLAEGITKEARIHGDILVAKMYPYNIADEKQRIMFEQEVSIMALLSNEPNVAKIIGYCVDPLCILMKFYEEGSFDIFEKKPYYKKVMTRRNSLKFLKDISLALRALHCNDISHSDLKPQNILVELVGKTIQGVLTDFGISHILSNKVLLVKEFRVINLKGISVLYAAPEAFGRMRGTVLSSSEDFKAGDVFSLSLIIFEVLSDCIPWL